MSIASELTRLQNAKAAIKQSLENKGATIDSSATLSDYPSIIDNLPSGGDNSVLKDLIERDITSIEIPEGTTQIGSYIFGNCSQLTSVTIPNSVTAIKGAAFGHSGIKTLNIPSSVTSIGNQVFMGSSLESITIPSTVTSFGDNVFNACASLTSVTFENNITELPQQTFLNATSLREITLPSSLQSIGDRSFYGCTGLQSINIPSNVTHIYTSAFEGCSNLTSITIPTSVTIIGDKVFNNCSSLQSITIEATTPPTLGNKALNNTNNCPIYVPCESVQAYKTATNWSKYADRITCAGGSDEPNNTVKLIQGGCYANSAESTFTYDQDGSGINYTLTGFAVANDLYYIQVTDANKSLVTQDYEGPTIKAGDTVTLTQMPYNVQGDDVDTWNGRGIYFGFKIDSGVTTLKVTIDTTNNTYTLTAVGFAVTTSSDTVNMTQSKWGSFGDFTITSAKIGTADISCADILASNVDETSDWYVDKSEGCGCEYRYDDQATERPTSAQIKFTTTYEGVEYSTTKTFTLNWTN